MHVAVGIVCRPSSAPGIPTPYTSRKRDQGRLFARLIGIHHEPNHQRNASAAQSQSPERIGDIKVTALFIAPVEKTPGDGLNAGCLRIDGDVKPPQDASLTLEGQPVSE